MDFLPFWEIRTIDITDGSCEITLRSDVTSHKPCNITLFCVIWNVTSSKPLITLVAVDRHLSQSEDVSL